MWDFGVNELWHLYLLLREISPLMTLYHLEKLLNTQKQISIVYINISYTKNTFQKYFFHDSYGISSIYLSINLHTSNCILICKFLVTNWPSLMKTYKNSNRILIFLKIQIAALKDFSEFTRKSKKLRTLPKGFAIAQVP